MKVRTQYARFHDFYKERLSFVRRSVPSTRLPQLRTIGGQGKDKPLSYGDFTICGQFGWLVPEGIDVYLKFS